MHCVCVHECVSICHQCVVWKGAERKLEGRVSIRTEALKVIPDMNFTLDNVQHRGFLTESVWEQEGSFSNRI